MKRKLLAVIVLVGVAVPAAHAVPAWSDCRGASIQKAYSDGDWRLTIQCEQHADDPFTAPPPPPPPPALTLTVSPATVPTGGWSTTILVEWSGIPNPMPGDWLGIYPAGIAPHGFLVGNPMWKYVDCQQHVGAGVQPVPAGVCAFDVSGLAPGHYQTSLLANEGMTELARAEFTIAAGPPPLTLTVSPATVPAGGSSATILVEWSGIPNPMPGDWLGIYPAGIAPHGFAVGNPMWKYVDCQQHVGAGVQPVPAGVCTFEIPGLAPGHYQTSLLANEGMTELARAEFTVAAGPPPLTLTVTPAIVPAGGSSTAILVEWSGIPNPTPGDWLGIYPAGVAPHGFAVGNPWWKYVDCQQHVGAGVQPVPAGVCAFDVSGLAPGHYQTSLLANEGMTELARAEFTVEVGASPAPPSPLPPPPGTRTLLTPADFSYLGYYDSQTNGPNSTYSQSLTHRYVNGQLRFLYLDYAADLGMVVTEAPLPAGTPFGAMLNHWSDYWMLPEFSGSFFGLSWDASRNRLWTTNAVDYTTEVREVQIYAYELGSSGSPIDPDDPAPVLSFRGNYHLQGLNAKLVYGKIQNVPQWFRTLYETGDMAALGGGYTSLVNLGGGASMGPAFFLFNNPLSLPTGGVTIPATAGADHRSGGSATDWYSQGSPTSFDRGVRQAPVTNYFDSGDPRPNPNTPPTNPPQASAQWLSPSPDGLGRWTWGDSYYDTCNWIDGPKHAIVCVASLATGRAWYQGSTLHFDGREAEIHIFDPNDLGEAVQGKRAAWNVKPRHILPLTLPGLGARGLIGNSPAGNAAGATYDATTGRLYILGPQGAGEHVNRIYAYQVAQPSIQPLSSPALTLMAAPANEGMTELARAEFTVGAGPPPLTLTVTPAIVPAGGSSTAILVEWSGNPRPMPGDWLGIYPAGVPPHGFAVGNPRWKYVDCQQHGAGVQPMPAGVCTFEVSGLAPGHYRTSLLAIEGMTELARAEFTVEVGAPPAPPFDLPPPPPPPAPSTGVLAPWDFTYLGAVRAPGHAIGVGALAGKNENGQITLYMLSPTGGGELYSMPYNGQASIASPPTLQATFQGYPTWNGEQNLKVSWDYGTGALRSSQTTSNPWPELGMAYHEGKLYISYLDYYNTDHGATDHCLVVADLTKPGPWRSTGPYRFTNTSVKRICGGLTATPDGLGMGGSMMALSRNMDNSWGPSLSILPFDAIGSNPGGFNSPSLSLQERLMHTVDARASRASDYQPNLADPYNPDGPPPPPGFWTQRDRMNAIAWIETASGKRGFLTMGGMATGQVWYGSWNAGPNGLINHCQSAGRGENAEGFRPEWRIYDPNQLTGGVVQPDYIFSPWDLSPHPNFDACERYYTGAYFDRATGLLFAASLGEIQVWHVR